MHTGILETVFSKTTPRSAILSIVGSLNLLASSETSSLGAELVRKCKDDVWTGYWNFREGYGNVGEVLVENCNPEPSLSTIFKETTIRTFGCT